MVDDYIKTAIAALDDGAYRIIKPIHMSLKYFIRKIDGRFVLIKSSPQCPKHFYALFTIRCQKHDSCLEVEACKGCIQDKKEKHD